MHSSNPRDALCAISKRELRLEAKKLGVEDDAIDAYLDDEMPKDAFIELVAAKSMEHTP